MTTNRIIYRQIDSTSSIKKYLCSSILCYEYLFDYRCHDAQEVHYTWLSIQARAQDASSGHRSIELQYI